MAASGGLFEPGAWKGRGRGVTFTHTSHLLDLAKNITLAAMNAVATPSPTTATHGPPECAREIDAKWEGVSLSRVVKRVCPQYVHRSGTRPAGGGGGWKRLVFPSYGMKHAGTSRA